MWRLNVWIRTNWVGRWRPCGAPRRASASPLIAGDARSAPAAMPDWRTNTSTLRLALELLYLKDFANEHSQEMRFRLSLFGAWHLGVSLDERRRIRRTLRDAYDMASKAVHLGEVPGRGANDSVTRTGSLPARGYSSFSTKAFRRTGEIWSWGLRFRRAPSTCRRIIRRSGLAGGRRRWGLHDAAARRPAWAPTLSAASPAAMRSTACRWT